MQSYPEWLHVLAWVCLVLCWACSAWIILDLLRGHSQRMAIMNVVWPVTALYFGPAAVWMYYRTRPLSMKTSPMPPDEVKRQMKDAPPTFEQVAVAVFHCGAGCTLGDIAGEAGLFAAGQPKFIGGSEFATKIIVDFLLAYLFGVIFQYLTIAPMRSLSLGKGIAAAVRADTISIVAFEMGMFGWMAITRYVLFPEPVRIMPNTAVFWFMMQIAMMIGWATSYPANVWLIRNQWKEKMPQYPSMGTRQQHELLRRA